MSLTGFQSALADLIASPAFCLRAREDPGAALAAYDLTALERRRLEIIVANPGMSINCTLFRVNRLTPIMSVLPLTCRFLGDRLSEELDAFWMTCEEATMQYGREAARFARWLLARIRSGALPWGPLEDAIAFELAAFEVRTAPLHAEDGAEHPRKRLLHFKHDPQAVLDYREGPIPNDDAGGGWLLLDASEGELQVRRVRGLTVPLLR